MGRINERVLELRDQAESADGGERCAAVIELIAAGHYLSYSDAKYAAQLALSGAHAREGVSGRVLG